ncbi:unnamed protein product [Camellia sinensis]
MGSLKKLYLSHNELTGTIPSSVAHPNKLLEYPRRYRRGTPNSFQKRTILIDLPEEYKMIVDLPDSFQTLFTSILFVSDYEPVVGWSAAAVQEEVQFKMPTN